MLLLDALILDVNLSVTNIWGTKKVIKMKQGRPKGLIIPEGQWLWGIKLVTGEYVKAVGPTIEEALNGLGLTSSEVKRYIPLKSGIAQAKKRESLQKYLEKRLEKRKETKQ